jgi:hypothetical protein
LPRDETPDYWDWKITTGDCGARDWRLLRLKPAADGRACKRGCQTCLTLLTPRILLNDRSAARSWDLEEISGVRLLHLDFLRPLLSQSESEMFVRSDLRSENRRVEVATFWIGAQGILVEIRSGCQDLARGRIKAVLVIRARSRKNTVIVFRRMAVFVIG